MTHPMIPLIHLKGNHLEIGRQYGEVCRDQIKHSIANARQLVADTVQQIQLNWEGTLIQARKYLPFAEERFPRYIDELQGIADGAGVTFDEVAVVNAMEAVTMDALHLTKCTSIAISQERSSSGHVLVAHNEDWLPDDEPDLVILHVSPNDEPPFLGMTYGALLPNIGLNADGIAQCCDSVYPNDPRIGIPRVIVSRAVLASRTPADAIRKALSPQRAAGYNHLIAHDSGELYNVEVSARRFAVLGSEDGCIVHTNHYLHPTMQAIESEPDELVATRVRYFRARRLLGLVDCHSYESLRSILRDHVNFPDSICNHAENDLDPLDREKTITGLIMDLSERKLFATWGNPCHNEYHEYSL
jgi:isopenicillin-N N-acyltransferase-like protein